MRCIFVFALGGAVAWQPHVAAPGLHAAAPRLHARAARVLCETSATVEGAASAIEAPKVLPPYDRDEMLAQATAANKRAYAAGKRRFTLRLFLPRGDSNELAPPDESWEGGIMQLYYAATPLVREIVRRMSTEVAGVPPSLTEKRLDTSGVDGEAVWFAQSSQPQDDSVGLVQPSAERISTIKQLSEQCGAERCLLMVNPQWKERDDPLDALSRKGGFLGALGNALGGKAAMESELSAMGFVATYTLSEYVCRGSRICLLLSYPYAWSAFYRNAETDGWEPLLSGAEDRPTYQQVESALIDQDVPFRFTEFDVNNIV